MIKTTNLDDLISANEVGDILKWDMQKVYRFAREGKLPVAKKVGAAFLFDRNKIEKFAKEEKANDGR